MGTRDPSLEEEGGREEGSRRTERRDLEEEIKGRTIKRNRPLETYDFFFPKESRYTLSFAVVSCRTERKNQLL